MTKHTSQNWWPLFSRRSYQWGWPLMTRLHFHSHILKQAHSSHRSEKATRLLGASTEEDCRLPMHQLQYNPQFRVNWWVSQGESWGTLKQKRNQTMQRKAKSKQLWGVWEKVCHSNKTTTKYFSDDSKHAKVSAGFSESNLKLFKPFQCYLELNLRPKIQ